MPFTPPGVSTGSGPFPGPLFAPPTATAPVVASAPPTSSLLLPVAPPLVRTLTPDFLHHPTLPLGVKSPLWQHISVGHDQALAQMEGRQAGTIKSLKTPWENFNDVGLNGLEWNSMMVIAARPGVGKTLLASLISDHAPSLNPDQEFLTLDFQFEMLSRNMAMRELSSHMGVSIKALNSAEKVSGAIRVLSDAELGRARTYAETQRNRPHFVVEKAMSPEQIGRTAEQFYKTYKLPFIAKIDHSMLALKGATAKDKVEMLQELGAMATDTKRRIPILWIILSQLNRTIDDVSRQEKPGSLGNYPNEGDLFGGDALYQHADIVALMNRPSKYSLSIYGPDRFEVRDANLTPVHFAKVRSGNPRISFFISEFEKMNFREVLPPAKVPFTTRGSFTP